MKEEGLSQKRFVVDVMLGKVAKWLRILGFDARYERLEEERFEEYRREGSILLTRNRRWCNRERVLCLSADDPMEQLREVASRVPIAPEELQPFRRCVLCNRALHPVTKDEAFGFVPDYVFETHSSFHRCPQCRRVYWSGSHSTRMMERLERVLG